MLACLTLNRPRIDEEFVLIWLPDTPQAPWLRRVSQVDINDIARSCHLIWHAHGEPPHMQQRPRADTPALRRAYRAFHTLLSLIPGAADHLDTTSPRDLGAVLTSLVREPDKRRMADSVCATYACCRWRTCTRTGATSTPRCWMPGWPRTAPAPIC